ncbi:hypothetical protein Tco_0494546 [Tanacetum coccineum]
MSGGWEGSGFLSERITEGVTLEAVVVAVGMTFEGTARETEVTLEDGLTFVKASLGGGAGYIFKSSWTGDAISARDAITQRTTGPLPVNQSLPEKTARLKEVEISDPKIVVIRERKARAAAKKRAERKRAADGEGGSKGKTKRRKVSAVRAEEEDSTEEASSASPLRTVAPNPSFLLKDVDDAGTAESREDEHVSVPRHDSANTSIHNYAADHDESFDESRGHGETVETHPADETRLTETPVPARNPEKTAWFKTLFLDHTEGAESSVLVLFTFLNRPWTTGGPRVDTPRKISQSEEACRCAGEIDYADGREMS